MTNYNVPNMYVFAFLVGVYLLFWYMQIMVIIKRFHDINWPGYIVFILIAINLLMYIHPGFKILNLIIAVPLLFWDGTEGPNKYGRDPKMRVSQRRSN